MRCREGNYIPQNICFGPSHRILAAGRYRTFFLQPPTIHRLNSVSSAQFALLSLYLLSSVPLLTRSIGLYIDYISLLHQFRIQLPCLFAAYFRIVHVYPARPRRLLARRRVVIVVRFHKLSVHLPCTSHHSGFSLTQSIPAAQPFPRVRARDV